MANLKLTKTITQPEAVINAFANDLGYQEKVQDPNYTVKDEMDTPPIVDNPQSRIEFVSDKFDELTVEWLSKFAERNLRKVTEDSIRENMVLAKTEIKKTLSTEIS
jgi:hypothetical protein